MGGHDSLRPETLGPRYQVRLGDLRSWHVLEASCFVCRHRAVLDLAALRRRYSEHERLKRLEPLLRCTLCKNRVSNRLTVCRLPRNA